MNFWEFLLSLIIVGVLAFTIIGMYGLNRDTKGKEREIEKLKSQLDKLRREKMEKARIEKEEKQSQDIKIKPKVIRRKRRG